MTATHYEVHSATAAWKMKARWRKFLESKEPGERWKAFPVAIGGASMPDGTPIPGTTPDGATALLFELIALLLDESENKYSYGRIARTEDFGKLVQYILAQLRWSAPNITTSMILTYHMLSHERAGKRAYEVSPALGEQLQHTELRGLLTDDLRLPYENILIQVPESLGIEVWNKDTGWHRLRDVYVTEEDYVGNEEMGISRGWRIMLCGASKSGDIGDDALSHFWITLPEGKKLDEQLDILEKNMRSEDVSGETFGPMQERWRAIFEWIMNVVLYATWSDPGERIMRNRDARQLWNRIQKMPTNKPKRKELLHNFQNMNPQRRIVLGGNVRIQRHEGEEGAQDSGTNGGGRAGGPLWVRTRVSGHWRNQPHGPGKTLRKLIFIAPFWRGPEDAPVSAPRHEVT